MTKTYIEQISISKEEAQEIIAKAVGCKTSDVNIDAYRDDYTGECRVCITVEREVRKP